MFNTHPNIREDTVATYNGPRWLMPKQGHVGNNQNQRAFGEIVKACGLFLRFSYILDLSLKPEFVCLSTREQHSYFNISHGSDEADR